MSEAPGDKPNIEDPSQNGIPESAPAFLGRAFYLLRWASQEAEAGNRLPGEWDSIYNQWLEDLVDAAVIAMTRGGASRG